MSDLWTFNGINARSGAYLLQASPGDLASVATGKRLDAKILGELQYRHERAHESHFGVKAGVDPSDLSEAGWGAIFPAVKPQSEEARAQEAILEALAPLLKWRKAQATQVDERYFKLIIGGAGYRPGETKQELLARQGVGPGPADPEKLPYYLLLVGDPVEIPFRIQSLLGVQYAVGRICFPKLEDYANYARSVVAAEQQRLTLPRRATFFGVCNPDDGATLASSRYLTAPVAEALSQHEKLGDWSIETVVNEAATRAALAERLRGEEAPALLFTASHGMGFDKGDPLQIPHQGALLCQDWPGPYEWHKPIPEDFYFAGDHLEPDANLLGQIAFFFACYGGGTPELDEFSKRAFKDREAIAERAFVARLPQAMLSLPRGGALAVVGHVERAWGHSFLWNKTGEGGRASPQLAVFQSALEELMQGMPVGAAMEYFDLRYAELASDLSERLEESGYAAEVDEYALANLWTAHNDARGYAVFGDPAVRIQTASAPGGRGAVSLGEVAAAAWSEVARGASQKAPGDKGDAASPSAAEPAPTPTSFSAGEATASGVSERPPPAAPPPAPPPPPTREATATGEARQRSPGPQAPKAPTLPRGEDLLSVALARWAALEPVEVKTSLPAPEGAGDPPARVFRTVIGPLGAVETILPADPGATPEALAVHERMVERSQERSLEVLKALISLLKAE